MRPNVLLVVLDAARRDALEPYGAAPGATPVIADLAGRGVAMDDVFATACWTIPSHASMLTGLLPRAAGLGGGAGLQHHHCRPVVERHADRLLPEVLRREGYATGAVSANLWLSEESGFATGFDEFVSVVTRRRQHDLTRTDPRSRLRWAAQAVLADADDGAADAGSTLGRWLARPPRQPFLWFVNLVECHSPYLPPRPYNDLSPIGRLRAGEEARRHLTFDAILRACVGGFDIPDGALSRMRHLYRQSVRLMDDWLGRVLTMLDERRLLDDTLVVVTSDHGENLGEGGLITHGLSLDDRLLRVPLVAAGPGAPDDDGPTSLAALPRLIARTIGLERHPWAEQDLPRGAAVAQLDPPVAAGDPYGRELVNRWGLGDEALRRLTARLECATDGRTKLLRRDGKELLFRLHEDPLEQSPIPVEAGGGGDEVSALRMALAHPAASAEPPQAQHASQQARPAASAEETRDLEERMRLLGYL